MVVVERDDVACGCGEIMADRLIDWHEAQPHPWVSFDGDVGETVLPQESGDFCPYVPSRVVCKFSFLWIVKLYCPYDAKDPFLMQVMDVVVSRFESWNYPGEVGADYMGNDGKQGLNLLEGDLFVAGSGVSGLVHGIAS